MGEYAVGATAEETLRFFAVISGLRSDEIWPFSADGSSEDLVRDGGERSLDRSVRSLLSAPAGLADRVFDRLPSLRVIKY